MVKHGERISLFACKDTHFFSFLTSRQGMFENITRCKTKCNTLCLEKEKGQPRGYPYPVVRFVVLRETVPHGTIDCFIKQVC